MRKLLLFLLLISCFAFAQSNYASVEGAVSDPQGHPFAGATLQLTSLTTRAERRVSSNEQGRFQITALPPGEYELRVLAEGFAILSETLRLEVGQQMTANFALKVAVVKDVVEVAGQPEALHTTDAAVGEVIEPAAIRACRLTDEC